MEWRVETAIETARGNHCLVIRSEQGRYKYSRIRALSTGETRYRCTNRRCNVNVFLDPESSRVVRASNLTHSHPGLKPSQFTLVKLRTACKQFARENIGLKPVDELIREAYEIGAFSIPPSKKRLLKKAIHTAKRHVISLGNQPHRKHEECAGSFEGSGYGFQDEPILIDDDDILVPKVELDEEPVAESSLLLEGRTCGQVFAEPVHYGPSSPLLVASRTSSPVETTTPPVPVALPRLVKSEPGIKMEAEEDTFDAGPSSSVPFVKQEPVKDQYVSNMATQTDLDPDLNFLIGLLPSMKKLSTGDKSMMKAQIQQLFMWKLNKK